MFRGLDHLAIVVSDTEQALKVWRDRFGFPVLFSETVANGTLLLTHLDLGNTHMQLVQPLNQDHPLWDWLQTNGTGLHHLCLAVENVAAAIGALPDLELSPGEPRPHQGTLGKQALFLDRDCTAGVQVELTGD